MDAYNIQHESKELAEKLASKEQIDYDYAINQYFEDHAQFRGNLIATQGVTQIKKLFWLNALVKKEGYVVGQPRYDSSAQRVSFQIGHKYESPTLPSIIPFAKQFSNFQTGAINYNCVAHLAQNNDDQGSGGVKGQKLFVTLLEAEPAGKFPLQGLVPLSLFRPILSIAVLMTASALAFTQKHKGDNPIQFVLAAVAAVWTAMWDTLMAESSKRRAQAEQWSDKKSAQLNQLYDATMRTAARIQADLEARGKAAGIPVDDYKQRLVQAYSDLHDNIDARAKAAGVSVEEYRKQAQATVDDLRSRATAAGQQLSDAALKVQADLQARTQAAGIPLNDYRQRLVQAYSELSQNVEARAKAAGVPVDEYRKQAQAAIEDMQQRAAAAGQQITEAAYKIQADLEARGRAAGIPVDDYKSRVAQAYNDLQDNVEARARAAGVPVDEYKKQVQEIIDDLLQRAQAAGQQVEQKGEEAVQGAKQAGKQGKKKADKSAYGNGEPEFVANSTEPAKSHEEIEAEFAKVPHTPLGGHDPTAPNAPSFAAAAQL